MKVEINSAADFLMNLLRVRQTETLTENQLHSFKSQLVTVLHEKFLNHWYTENPRKGKRKINMALLKSGSDVVCKLLTMMMMMYLHMM
jgi:hypothetical protein